MILVVDVLMKDVCVVVLVLCLDDGIDMIDSFRDSAIDMIDSVRDIEFCVDVVVGLIDAVAFGLTGVPFV